MRTCESFGTSTVLLILRFTHRRSVVLVGPLSDWHPRLNLVQDK